MFTGLVQAVGQLRELRSAEKARRVVVAVELPSGARSLGASVAVNGVCLTVTESSSDAFSADIAFETLDKTTLGDLREGARVNIEPSLRLGDPLGGHLVSGHVDGVGKIRSIESRGEAWRVGVWVPEPLRRFIATKGSICIDGVSLTVNEVDDEGFYVGIVPHTLSVTTLGKAREGQPVNLEVDLLARYVERILLRGGDANDGHKGVSHEQLLRAGFIRGASGDS